MVGFITENSVYRVDEKKKTIVGGVFKTPQKYRELRCLKYLPAVVVMPDGQELSTSTVTDYINATDAMRFVPQK